MVEFISKMIICYWHIAVLGILSTHNEGRTTKSPPEGEKQMAISAIIHFHDKNGFEVLGLPMVKKQFADLKEAIAFTNEHGKAKSRYFENFRIFYEEIGTGKFQTYDTRMSF